MKHLKSIRIILGWGFIPAFIAFIYFSNVRDRYCGVIIEKPEVSIASGSKGKVFSERFFIIKYDKGFTKSLEPSVVDYYTHKVGDRICYELNIAQTENRWDYKTYISSIMVIIGFIAFSINLWIALEDDFWKG